MSFDKKGQHKESSDLQDKVLFVNRCAKVVKGGRTFSFSALVSVGDGKGRLGIGFGKASDVSDAIRKGTESAMKNVRQYPIGEITIEHQVHGAADGTEVLIKPTEDGTGIIAGSYVRILLEQLGVKNIVAKVLKGRNPANIVRATIAALEQLESSAKVGV
ncbi:30S ribosomal protein S5 [bacterium]|jgi:small subunit ribosomal protein S5|nr:30S ribosomal protein S5 [Chlamydiota bacterium]NDD99775.1 30S ribosomal protein S5 [bacterium]